MWKPQESEGGLKDRTTRTIRGHPTTKSSSSVQERTIHRPSVKSADRPTPLQSGVVRTSCKEEGRNEAATCTPPVTRRYTTKPRSDTDTSGPLAPKPPAPPNGPRAGK
eukprot:6909161-Alexandrium_andersonii.AAC.1